jgi:hypothetical protein
MRTSPRPRRPVNPALLKLLAPVFRYSLQRDAYILRAVGGHYGPVLGAAHDEPRARSVSTSEET